ncbi:MAG: hypothetical protein NTW95_03315 [Candidatus Aminicenantes bacterium]|nr:hypothetical protein [Candidatus Aminicenantes bacterium]
MNHTQKSIIVLGFIVIALMMGCKASPSAPEGIVGGGKLRYHAEAQTIPGDYQTEDGIWSFSIEGDGEGNYTISGSGNVTWLEPVQANICTWEAVAIGTVTLTGEMTDCELTFHIKTVWNNPQLVNVQCPYELQAPTFDQTIFQDVAGPFPLQVGASIVVPPDVIWAGKAFILDEIVINSESTMCKIIK